MDYWPVERAFVSRWTCDGEGAGADQYSHRQADRRRTVLVAGRSEEAGR